MAKYIVVHSVRVCTEFTPETYGRLTTIGPKFRLAATTPGQSESYQVCRCECGAVKVVLVNSLRVGHTKSCGCFQKDNPSHKTHGGVGTPAYGSWRRMRARCDNPNNIGWNDYGGRGITYCERWKKFENFFADIGEKPSLQHTIDRFPDKDGDYGPSNCRWADVLEQANNKRNNLLITIDDKTDTLSNWCRFYGVPYNRTYNRITAGWDPKVALSALHRK